MIFWLDGSLRIGVVDGLVNPHNPQEIVLKNTQVQQKAVRVPSNAANHRSGNSIQDEVVGGCNNGREDECWVRHAQNTDSHALPGIGSNSVDGERGNCQANKERVAKVQRGHGSILIAESVRCPNAALPRVAVNTINESEALRLRSVGSVIVRITQQPRRHARPQSKDDKCNEVAHGHCSTSSFIQSRSSGYYIASGSTARSSTLLRGSEVKQGYQEEDCSRNMNKGVDSVYPMQQNRALQKPLLKGHFPEDPEALL